MRPTFQFVLLIFILAFITFLIPIFPVAELFFIIILFSMGIALIIDIIYLRSFKIPEIKRKVNKKLSINILKQIVISIRGFSPLFYKMEITDTPPLEIMLKQPMGSYNLLKKIEKEFIYEILPLKRGDFSFEHIYIRIYSPLHFLFRTIKIKSTEKISIIPDMHEVNKYEALLKSGTLEKMGIKLSKLRGEGSEFENLREYQRDDDYKWIDWKATARKNKIISREYEPEKNQSIFFVLDAGRNLTNKVNNITKFDHLLNTAVLLARVATSYNDHVGILVFSDRIIRFIPPEKFKRSPSLYMDMLYDVQSEYKESNYELAYSFLMTQIKKRSMIITFTDLMDEYFSERVIKFNSIFIPKHLPLCVSISDSQLIKETKKVVEKKDDIFEHFAALEVYNDYLKTIRILSKKGIEVVSVPAEKLSISTINRYINLKTRGRL
ncbi:DUF58 domain-containing protein [bacterium]|nr:DUF58 domain-containing protein [bacterium]